ncbi:hypothetical protein C0J52_13985 [Blattella germanica]|nr:hypothetical protein C0J52_13985 [Blattella germanica]
MFVSKVPVRNYIYGEPQNEDLMENIIIGISWFWNGEARMNIALCGSLRMVGSAAVVDGIKWEFGAAPSHPSFTTRKVNRSEEAALMLERCVRLDAAYIPAYLLLARLYQGQEGRGPAVGRLLRHVARLQPHSPDHLAELAAWLHRQGHNYYNRLESSLTQEKILCPSNKEEVPSIAGHREQDSNKSHQTRCSASSGGNRSRGRRTSGRSSRPQSATRNIKVEPPPLLVQNLLETL